MASEATKMASEATKMPIRGNMHMNIRVFEVADLNSEISIDLRGHLTCFLVWFLKVHSRL